MWRLSDVFRHAPELPYSHGVRANESGSAEMRWVGPPGPAGAGSSDSGGSAFSLAARLDRMRAARDALREWGMAMMRDRDAARARLAEMDQGLCHEHGWFSGIGLGCQACAEEDGDE